MSKPMILRELEIKSVNLTKQQIDGFKKLLSENPQPLSCEYVQFPHEELIRLRRFKEYWDELYGTGLDIANWHQNGQLESFDNFYDSAMDEYDEDVI